MWESSIQCKKVEKMMKLAFLLVLMIAIVVGSETTQASLESRGLFGLPNLFGITRVEIR